MRSKLRPFPAVTALAAVLLLFTANSSRAQTIGVLQSAETVDRGVFKLMAAPLFFFGEDETDDEIGVAARAGYGFTEKFDGEFRLGFFENTTYVGADGEIWLLGTHEEPGPDFSLTGGLHGTFGSNGNYDTFGIDLTPQLSGHLTRNLELCGALDASFEAVQDAPEGVDESFARIHLVPGIEYRLSEIIDVVAEGGIALNDESSSYLGAGLCFYLR